MQQQQLIISASNAPADITNLRLVRMIGSIPVHIPAGPLGLLGNDIGTAVAGDMIYASAANTWARLAKGTALQHLRMNAGATAPEWASYATIESLEGLSFAAGDILYATGADTLARLPKGTALQHLRQNTALTAPEWATAREVITANRTYYVRTDGSDSNTGLVNNSGGAFLTIQKAVNTISALDLGGFTATISVGAGTFAAPSLASLIGGNGAISGAGATTVLSGILVSDGIVGRWTTSTVKFVSSSFTAVFARQGAIYFGTGVEFGACTGYHVQAAAGGYVQFNNSYAISGGATIHWLADGGEIFGEGITITITTTPAFTTAFAVARAGGRLYVGGDTFSGSATGTRYSATENSVIRTYGAGATYLPGNVGGATATGGQYV